MRLRTPAAAIVVATTILAIGGPSLLMVRESFSDTSPVESTLQRLKEHGVEAEEADAGEVTISSEQAKKIAASQWPGGVPSDSRLIRATSGGMFVDRLAWAVTFNPTSLGPAPLGGRPESKQFLRSLPAEWLIVLVDAQTGEALISSGSARVIDCRKEAIPDEYRDVVQPCPADSAAPVP